MNGQDTRSTIMIRNIPNRYNQNDFLRIIDTKFKGLYDFLYLPMDFKVNSIYITQLLKKSNYSFY